MSSMAVGSVDRRLSMVVVDDEEDLARRRIGQLLAALDAIGERLKPFGDARVRQPLDRAQGHRYATDDAAPPRYLDRMLIKTGAKSVVVRTADIDRLQAEGNYVRVHVEAKSYLVRDTMTRMDTVLDPRSFARIHRSAIVNLERVREVAPCSGHDFVVRLSTGARVRMSRWYRHEFQRRMLNGTG